MARLGLVLDPVFAEHDTGPSHPERPDRIRILQQRLAADGLENRFQRIPPREATDEELLRVHDAAHLQRVHEACASGRKHIDSMDTAIGPSSDRVARLAAGALVDLCRATAAGDLDGGFAAVRPPGHHAEREIAMGFCLYNAFAVAARDLVQNH